MSFGRNTEREISEFHSFIENKAEHSELVVEDGCKRLEQTAFIAKQHRRLSLDPEEAQYRSDPGQFSPKLSCESKEKVRQ